MPPGAASEAGTSSLSGGAQPAYLKWLNKPQKRNACIMRLCCFGGAVSGVQYTPDGLRIGSSHEDGVVRLWHTTTGDIERTLVMSDRVKREVSCFEFLPVDK